jgi:hypothetical protein
MAVADYVDGRWPSSKELPYEIREFLIVKETGWTLDYIRNLSMIDFEKFSLISHIYRIKMDNKRARQMSI